MNIFSLFYHESIARPLFNGLVGIYILLPYRDLGLAIIALTVVVRVILHPSIRQSARSQAAMAAIQPKLSALKERYKNDREALNRETMALYKAEGVHPMSGCLPLLVQLPVLIGLYQLFWKGITSADRPALYSFISGFEGFNPVAFGLLDLTAPSAALAIAAGASQFLQAYVAPKPQPASGKSGEFATAMQWQMVYIFPAIITLISWSLPSALSLYWTIFNVFAILQQRFIERSISHVGDKRTHHPNPGENGPQG